MPSAKQQPSNIKHDVGKRPNVCKLTFGPLCIYRLALYIIRFPFVWERETLAAVHSTHDYGFWSNTT